jgi:apolipoprotein N-acyltransferase
LDRLLTGQATDDDLKEIRQWTASVNDDLLLRADREAQGGAKVVFWAEGNALVLKQDEAALLARGSEMAAKDHVYLGMALAALNPSQNKPLENKLAVAPRSSKLRSDGSVQ